ncbi:Uma2 family endonuclease [Streptomyces sp. LBUM 1478]|uniref:Uma2 family endonuclease n=1 Tax=Streptomyces scabiei TaxID=1930 RepID=UPI00076615D5|nr:Uma2 family endonuclease [Streptomyces scabiei]MBP5906884.1 Uma2 family endonuclease [Streptomyces sp. LBUM 1478]MBP5930387.1 Uma2 family endonuclease [Streptomyces sp. LBUM 1479]MDX3278143.1 Uma2 family endonuclease [Streptomyces scabiei]
MRAGAERTSQMSVEEFEAIASAAPETVTLEFIDGRLGVKRAADGSRGTVVAWLARRCMRSRPDLDLYRGQGLRVDVSGEGRARPDAVLVPEAHFAGHGEWADPDGVLMVVEVTPYDADTDRWDRQEKPAVYGRSGIPLYLLIDRGSRTVVVHSRPDPLVGGYREVRTAAFGERVSLPEPVGTELDTEILGAYVR